jgi:sulfatase maturation enzyme AslB (radical SAM superfamily)
MKDMYLKEKLTNMQFWGGEPTYGLYRALPTIYKAIDYFPNLTGFMFSTNLATSTCVDDIANFYESICKYAPERNFYFYLQLSLDGPLDINDFNRGEGTTEKFTKNFCELLIRFKHLLNNNPNLNIHSHVKPTLDGNNILNLKTKQDVIDYFEFLEKYRFTFDQILGSHSERTSFFPGIPNTACPSPHTKEEGKAFANVCKNIKELYIENPDYFRTYTNIMPFYNGEIVRSNSFIGGYSACGTGDSVLGLLPNRLISACHNGFVELLGDYKKQGATQTKQNSLLEARFFNPQQSHANILIFNEKEYAEYERQLEVFYNSEEKFKIVEMASLICTIAHTGQIDEKYKNYEDAIQGAHFIQERTASCMRDNIVTTGSKYSFATGYIRLFLNGAREEMEQYAKLLESK